MNYREANLQDIKQIQRIRQAVKENMLSNPALVTQEVYEDFLFNRGKGWVCEIEGCIVGFAIADLVDNNIWALFILPEVEGKGIGYELHNLMLDWYFSTGKDHVWLGTSPQTRAEGFYKKMGWTSPGLHGEDEIKFEMSRATWLERRGIGQGK